MPRNAVPRTARAALREAPLKSARDMTEEELDAGTVEAEATIAPPRDVQIPEAPVRLGALLSRAPIHQRFKMWLVGDTPLIVHSWSHKAKLAMLEKQGKATKAGREERDPDQDFLDSLYEMSEPDAKQKSYGFPVTGIKNAILSSAHKDKGIARVAVMQALFLEAEMVRARPAKAGAIC